MCVFMLLCNSLQGGGRPLPAALRGSQGVVCLSPESEYL